jgi:mono/diheme cytochrome c family protein
MARWIDGRRPRRWMPRLACLLVALGTVALAAGCGGAGDDTTATSRPTRRVVQIQHTPKDRWTYARARFNEMCAGCHTLGDAGAKGRRYNLDRSVAVEEAHVRYAIAEGEPGMPAWRGVLSRREYEELVAYIVTVARHQTGDTYWNWQIRLRGEGEQWTPNDTKRLEAKWARREAGADKPDD